MTSKNLLLLLFLLVSGMMAVKDVKAEKNPWFTAKDNLAGNKTYFELFGGASYPNMVFSDANYDESKRNSLFLPDFGLSARFQMKKLISFGPRLSYSGAGLSLSGNSNYQMKLNYLNFSVPVDLQFPLGKRNQTGTTKFFIYAGPYIALPVSANIAAGGFSGNLKMADLTKPDYGLDAGLGFRIPTFSLESRSYLTLRLCYTRGFADTYSLAESTMNTAINDQLFLDGGKRYSSCIKLIVGVEIPLKNKKMISFTAGGDGKKNFKKIVIIDEK